MERLTEAIERRGSRSCRWMRQDEGTYTCLTDKMILYQVECDLEAELGARGFVTEQARLSMGAGKEQKEVSKVGAMIESAELVREALRGMGRVMCNEQVLTQQVYSHTDSHLG